MTPVDSLLVAILSTRRCDGSVGDTNFRLWLKNYLEELNHDVTVGVRGNLIVSTDEGSKVLFSCHVDTVHSMEESNGQKQLIAYDSHKEHIILAENANSTCLGADDGVGIWIMLKMIEANVPGTYIFHTGEEKGGQGSGEMLLNSKDWLAKFDIAVAFDRPNNNEVIITQRGTVCASDESGQDLADKLSEFNLSYEVSERGVFTDTKNYTSIIPECFNIGVGYAQQHSKDEYLDYTHAVNLLDACIKLDWESIVVGDKSNKVGKMPQFNWGNHVHTKPIFTTQQGFSPKHPQADFNRVTYDSISSHSIDELTDFCELSPRDAAVILMKLNALCRGKDTELEVLYEQLEIQ